MKLQDIFQLVTQTIGQSGIKYLMIGGYAVNYYGYTRNTLDVDFMIAAEDAVQVRQLLKEAGFSNMSDNGEVLFFNRPDSSLRIDFLKTDSETLQKLLQNAYPIQMFGVTIEVPSLLDLLAMKLFALSQAFERRVDKDLPDVAYLCVLNNLDLESDIHPLCLRYGSEAIYRQVVEKVETLNT
ncbi:MAG: nucleotidyl transferase AbiEii/AbiGii toxin family protein [bacterium]